MHIEQREVAADDRDRKSDDENSADCTHTAHDFAKPRNRMHVTVANGGDGDEGPPE